MASLLALAHAAASHVPCGRLLGQLRSCAPHACSEPYQGPECIGKECIPPAVGDLPTGVPLDALILEEPNEIVWEDETLEHNGLQDDPSTPEPLQAYITSFRLPSGTCVHAFSGGATPLCKFDYCGASGNDLTDVERQRLIFDLLDAVNFLHSRGSAHLGLDSTAVRVMPASLASPQDAESPRLQLIGLGAAVQLQSGSGRTAFQMSNEIEFHAPELLAGPLIASNLRSLMLMDAWSIGVLLLMIASSSHRPAFSSDIDWRRGDFSKEAALRRSIVDKRTRLDELLLEADASANGFLFRHGWLVRLLLGLLQPSPARRLTVHEAWEIGKNSTVAGRHRTAHAMTTGGLVGAKVSGESNERIVGGKASVSQKDSDLAGKKKLLGDRTGGELVDLEAQAVDGRIHELSRFRKMAARDSSGEPFRSLEAILNIADRHRSFVIMQPREGLKNYGEIIGFRNRADGDRWDVFVPGLSRDLPFGEPLLLNKVMGLLLVKGGNHKLAVELEAPYRPESHELIQSDIVAFTRSYISSHSVSKSRIKYLELDKDVLDEALESNTIIT